MPNLNMGVENLCFWLDSCHNLACEGGEANAVAADFTLQILHSGLSSATIAEKVEKAAKDKWKFRRN